MATRKRAKAAIEWVSGIISLPGSVTGEGEPYQPELLLWAATNGPVLGMEVGRPGTLKGRIVDHFWQTARAPMGGPAHVPTRIRVASEEIAGTLRAGLDEGIEILCAPTPEIDVVLAALSDQMSQLEEVTTYLAPGIEADAVAAFFHAAAGLFRAKPWDIAPDDQSLISVTIEALGAREAVLSVIGQMGESLGVVLFPDLDAFQAYLDAGDALGQGEEPIVPPHLSINFDNGAELHPALQKEIEDHGWEVASASAYPTLVVVDADVIGRPPTARELTLAEVLALALPQLLSEKEELQSAWKGEEAFSRTMTVAAHAGPFAVTLRALSEEESLAAGASAHEETAPAGLIKQPAKAADPAKKDKRKAARKARKKNR
jgi:hypothetical protein